MTRLRVPCLACKDPFCIVGRNVPWSASFRIDFSISLAVYETCNASSVYLGLEMSETDSALVKTGEISNNYMQRHPVNQPLLLRGRSFGLHCAFIKSAHGYMASGLPHAIIMHAVPEWQKIANKTVVNPGDLQGPPYWLRRLFDNLDSEKLSATCSPERRENEQHECRSDLVSIIRRSLFINNIMGIMWIISLFLAFMSASAASVEDMHRHQQQHHSRQEYTRFRQKVREHAERNGGAYVGHFPEHFLDHLGMETEL